MTSLSGVAQGLTTQGISDGAFTWSNPTQIYSSSHPTPIGHWTYRSRTHRRHRRCLSETAIFSMTWRLALTNVMIRGPPQGPASMTWEYFNGGRKRYGNVRPAMPRGALDPSAHPRLRPSLLPRVQLRRSVHLSQAAVAGGADGGLGLLCLTTFVRAALEGTARAASSPSNFELRHYPRAVFAMYGRGRRGRMPAAPSLSAVLSKIGGEMSILSS